MSEKMKKEDNSIEIEPTLASEIRTIQTYLAKHGITASKSEVIAISLRLSKRLGAGTWSFVCEGKQREKR